MIQGPDIWRLPGPAAFVDELVMNAEMGRSVVAVLPRYLASELDVMDDLAVATLMRLGSGRRLQPWPHDGPLTEAIGCQVVSDQNVPVTVSELVGHIALAGKTFVCVASDLGQEHRAELPTFLRRLAIVSQGLPPDERCQFIVVGDSSILPEFAGCERTDVTLANSWYWNRTSRWDAAAYLASQKGNRAQQSVLAEVRTETIIEVARWNFELAGLLAQSWSGDPMELGDLCKGTLCQTRPVTLGCLPKRPPDRLLENWDNGSIEGWHGCLDYLPALDTTDETTIGRHIWAAQSRVLLPWIELHRNRVEYQLRKRLVNQFDEVVAEFSRRTERPDVHKNEVLEIGLLNAIVQARVGRQDPELRVAAKELRRARNNLAHLRPLSSGSLQQLVRACEPLMAEAT